MKVSRSAKIRCAILGASGYSGMELVRLLALHPAAEIVSVTSNTYKDRPVRDVFPWAPVAPDMKFVPHDKGSQAGGVDIFFTAFPHGQCFPHIAKLLKKARVIDISADFRLQNPADYDRHYGYTHPMPEMLPKAVYGLPEVRRDAIRGARLLANPGCYPTSVLLGLLPLKDIADKIEGPIIVDAKSGYSGAGRTAQTRLLLSEGSNEFAAYKVLKHSHIGEMTQESGIMFGRSVGISFTPHLIPVARGILSAIYVRVKDGVTAKQLRALYEKKCAGELFMKLAAPGVSPSIKQVNGTNLCLMNVFLDEENGLIKIISAIDNLIKGAAGQAVQNMNIMFGVPEETGLPIVPVVP